MSHIFYIISKFPMQTYSPDDHQRHQNNWYAVGNYLRLRLIQKSRVIKQPELYYYSLDMLTILLSTPFRKLAITNNK